MGGWRCLNMIFLNVEIISKCINYISKHLFSNEKLFNCFLNSVKFSSYVPSDNISKIRIFLTCENILTHRRYKIILNGKIYYLLSFYNLIKIIDTDLNKFESFFNDDHLLKILKQFLGKELLEAAQEVLKLEFKDIKEVKEYKDLTLLKIKSFITKNSNNLIKEILKVIIIKNKQRILNRFLRKYGSLIRKSINTKKYGKLVLFEIYSLSEKSERIKNGHLLSIDNILIKELIDLMYKARFISSNEYYLIKIW